ncbi:MAG: tyrosine-type recombinase/integrase [Gammaproteobacteria bacterium]|nr:tyrosine-type recombinase/integrase [Gammaproteobacteria bacterium]
MCPGNSGRSGPLFRAKRGPRSVQLGEESISQASMYRLLLSYLEKLPGAMVDEGPAGGASRRRCRYSPHSLRATTATLLDGAGVPIKRIQELLGHKDIRVTQAYIKLLRDTQKSASHDMPI